jgi:spore maturation protein CgeB
MAQHIAQSENFSGETRSGHPLIIDFIFLIPEIRDPNKHIRSLVAAEAEECSENVQYRFFDSASYPPDAGSTTPPDAVVVFGSTLPPVCNPYRIIEAARKRYNCLVTAWVTDDPYEFDHTIGIAPFVDHVFTNDRGIPLYYGTPNISSLPLAAGEADHVRRFPDLLPDSEKEWDFIFCGVGFKNRIQVVEGLYETLRRYRTLVIGATHGFFGWPSKRLSGITFYETQPYSKVMELYRKSKLVLNLSRIDSICNTNFQVVASTPAPRTYEVAAMAIPQIAFYDRPEILEDYEPDQIAVFNNKKEFDTIAINLLNNVQERHTLGQKSRTQTLQKHLYRHRLDTIVRTLFPNHSISLPK